MYKLYGSPASRAARVMWALEEIGAPYEIVAAKPHSDALKAVNPLGKVPALLDGETAVFDSTAILLHLSDKHGMLTFPVGSPERSRLMSVVCFLIDDFEQPLWTVAKHSFILPEALRAKEAILPACHHDFRNALASLGALLGDGPFLMGETFTIADIIAGHLGGWAKATGFPEPEGAVADYMARVRARPGWQAVAKARAAAA